MASRLSVAAVVAVFAVIANCPPSAAFQPPPANDIHPPSAPKEPGKVAQEEAWAGRVVCVSTEKFGATMENVRVRQLAGRVFLVGRAVDDGDKAFSGGRVVWIALDTVTNIVEFSSVKEYRKAAEEARRAMPVAVPAVPAGGFPVPAPAS